MAAGQQHDSTSFFAEQDTILFVDDDPINTEHFVLSFEEEYEIITAESGEEALDIFQNRPGISVVISDQRMDGMSGVELLSRIYELHPDTVRIIITGYVDVSDIIDAINRGHIYQYVLKPWDIVQLRLILEQATQTFRLTRENQQLATALQEKNRLLLEANTHLRASEERLRSLSSRLIHTREDEQKRIALELHDELGQALAALKLQIRVIEKEQSALHGDEKRQEKLHTRLQELRDAINATIENVRRLSKNLSPVIIDDLGLDSAIKYLISQFEELYHITCTSSGPSPGSVFPADAHLAVYRILQEALTNCGKHSRASTVSLSIQPERDCVILIIKDNGQGFAKEEVAEQPAAERGIGLSVMAERATMLNGTMAVHTARGEGTELIFTLPIAADRPPDAS